MGMSMTPAKARPHESAVYGELAGAYDAVFGRVFYPRIAQVIRSLSIERGARVLEVGVGTGMSLDAYPEHCNVVGIDLAPDMLERARERISRRGWKHIDVQQGDALNLSFADDSFDYVMAFHVISVVPDAARMVDEMIRVTKPGGLMTIINHFRSGKRLVAQAQRLIDPMTRRLGWTTSLALPDVLAHPSLHVERQWKTSPTSLFTIVVARNAKALASRRPTLNGGGGAVAPTA